MERFVYMIYVIRTPTLGAIGGLIYEKNYFMFIYIDTLS